MPTLDHNTYQRGYYSRPERKPRMRPSRSRYVLRHLDTALEALGLADTAEWTTPPRILEVGCGMGRFTRLLLERGFDVTAVDLSPDLLSVLESPSGDDDAPARGRLTCICCDAAEIHRHVAGPFDAVVGFFFLHHLDDILPTLRAARSLLREGAAVAFCEPNAFHPLFYLQILFTPTMTWKGDRGVARMRAGLLRAALRDAGFDGARIERYGLFPPAVSNRPAFAAVEGFLERRAWLDPVLAFQVLSATAGT